MKFKNLLCMLMAMVLLLSFAGCGSAKSEGLSPSNNKDLGVYSGKSEMEDVKYEMSSSVEDLTGGMGYDKVEENGNYEEKLIYTVSIAAQTKEFDTALAAIRSHIKALGGYEESVSTTGAGYGSESYYTRRATLRLRIPSGSLDGFLDSVKTMVNVTSENIGMNNATEEYYDLEARLAVLREEQAAYEKMMGEAKDTNSLLKIKDRLYNVISEIESAKSRMNVIDSRSDYSTVTISLEEVKEIKPVTTPKTSFGARISESFRESWIDFAEGFEDFTVWFIGVIPTFLVLAVIGGGVAVLVIVSGRKHKKRMAKRKEDEENMKF